MTTVRTARLQIDGALRPRPVFCPIAHLHHDRKVAEAVATGRFEFSGQTRDLGTQPDWFSAELPPDEEWRIEWSKFYYGLDLAHAFVDSGEGRFLRAWEQLVSSWIDQVPTGSDATDVAARRIQNWSYAWTIFDEHPDFEGPDRGLAESIVESIDQQATYVWRNLTPKRNHRTLELYSLFVIALTWPMLDPGGRLMAFAIEELHHDLKTSYGPDGVHREQSTHYHMVTLRSFLAATKNARRFELDLPDDWDEHLERACEFALHCRRPDGLIPALSDADSADYSFELKLAASLFGRDDMLYAATAGAAGVTPAVTNTGWPDAGYHIQRSGWSPGSSSADERWLVFDCGPLGEGGHGHYDLLNVEIYGRGHPLVVDPGRFTYSEHGINMRHWFKGTAAHNTVCVDGLDQTEYRSGKPRSEAAHGRLRGRWTGPGLDILWGEATSARYEALHKRRVLFIGDEYWIIEDLLEGRETHRYDLRFHLAPAAHTDVEIADGSVIAPGLALMFDGDEAPVIENGWVAPAYGIKHAAPILSALRSGRRATFLTAVVPIDGRAPAPVMRICSRTQAATIVEVLANGRRDIVGWSSSGRGVEMELGDIRCTSAAARLRVSPTGVPLLFAACSVTEWSGIPGVESRWTSRPLEAIAWERNGDLSERRGSTE